MPSEGPGPAEGRQGLERADGVVFVLDEPQDLVNVAGTVRAMKNMGLGQLRLVRPAEFDAYRITGIAHRTEDVVERIRIFDSLREALADVTYVVGTTARPRTAARNYVHPRDMAPGLVERSQDGPVAVVFGREDRGLDNQALDLCHAVAVVPGNPDHPTLNLAQAVLLVAYEVHLAAAPEPAPFPRGKRSAGPTPLGELEQTYEALRDGLEAINFFKARNPDTVMRTLRTLVARAEPDRHEAGLLRAVGYEIGHYVHRLRTGAFSGGHPEGQGDAAPDREDSSHTE